ncbi:NTP pyrophosphohydrolase [Paenibacillus sp. FSL R7-0273]|uniref:NUDIX hydrolase n=1 Tax=Paenibacillus sp. FSL R7-0273 TaxID=1536772 RepID=UPI0004F81934|nr:NUDIX hydrolase [Paenibacillus sp. FSL R7-0273]AIQ45760.1 NTP pyrophosphohydrolase [Paenibacillus sp. FSL R7-0273]OMF95283.1 NTP pyrophosphohydrolase [Paenibacillus sp. FSL R7-0273]
MTEATNYIKWIRSKVGHDLIFLNFAGGIICNERNEVLLQRRGDSDQWGFPGGAMELGESAEETAIREIYEETGLKVKAEHLIGVYTKYYHQYSSGDRAQTISFFFQCKHIQGELTIDGNETLELRYFSHNELPQLFAQQHQDAYEDWLSGKFGVCR